MRNEYLKKVLFLLGILAAVDLGCSLFLIGHHLACELNPIMDFFVQHGLVHFSFAKLFFTGLSLALIWLGRNAKSALPASVWLASVMILVVSIQVLMILEIVFWS